MKTPDRLEFAQRFIRYASIFTQSEEGHTETPSTERQRELAALLYRELVEMGASDVRYDEKCCYVYAQLDGNLPAEKNCPGNFADAADKRRQNRVPIIGLVAHMDTSDAVPAEAVHPQLIREYDGNPIRLNDVYSIDPQEYPELSSKKGHMLITTDGTSVLGGDDKAGVVQIMEMFRFFLEHPEYPHGTVRLMFTPDEEVGNGIACMDHEFFRADYAYTVDGGAVGELEYENFNAANAKIRIRGRSAHPGYSKGIMINSLLVAMELNALLPAEEIPAMTEGYEGFYHLNEMNGTTESAELSYIIRDHDRTVFEERKETLTAACAAMNKKYGEGTVTLSLRDSYYNMAEKIRPQFHLVDIATEAIKAEGLEPIVEPIRGGTDGCQLSFMGIPCPNLGTGAYHFHSRFEYVSADELKTGTEILIRIISKYAEYELN